MSRDAVAEIDSRLRAAGDPARARHEKAYLKSRLDHLGVPVPVIRAVVGDVVRDAGVADRDRTVDLATALWAPEVHERRLAAVELLVGNRRLLAAADLPLVERLVRDAGTWALGDPLAEKVAGHLVEAYPESASTLDRWATDTDFWVRRAALLALLGPLRAGGGDFVRFGRYADALLDDREFFIRKAIGWVLRDTSRRRPKLVYDWLVPRAGRLSGVTRREAVRHLPAELRADVEGRRTVSAAPAKASRSSGSGP